LLSWISLFDNLILLAPASVFGFQSLLSWISLFDKNLTALP